jgi:type II secretory ATPase GspE/PulE/Tfp pilus assembly ATPase PilB-like protein/CheY-like chemotaxis protein
MKQEQITKVLIIDDDADMRNLLGRYVSKAPGVRTLIATSGLDGLDVCRREQPDLVLLDVMMPDMDGYQVCAQLHRDPSTTYIPVIFLTSLEKEQDKVRALSVGAADYLVKPVGREKLLEKLQQHGDTRKRWYSVRIATDLWDDAPLPQKFSQFRDLLVSQFGFSPGSVRQLQLLKAQDVYQIPGIVDMTDVELAERMAAFFGLEYSQRIETQSIQLGVLPTSFCRANYAIAIKDAGGQDAVVVSNPFAWDLDQLDALNRAFRGRSYRLMITTERTLAELFLEDPQKNATGVPTSVEVHEEETLTVERLMVAGAEPTVVEIVNVLIADAARKGASDLHIEPMRTNVRVRYRVDGGMRAVMPLQKTLLPNISARFKVMCGMDLSENRRPQDGSCTVRVGGEEMELRVSTLPGINGEIIVARILSRQTTGSLALADLGLEPQTLREFRSLLTARQGMILVTGPTGSGKTTTLYSALNHLNGEEVNIITVEDPVEVALDGINQVQVHDRAGRSFADTLRAMLRQDPDVLMVGEVRDVETAEIACRAALTGHLVLSTMHTQHTVGTLARLFDIGITPYLVASSLNGIMAQRLVRRVCGYCAQPYELPAALHDAMCEHFGDIEGHKFQKGTGCARCSRTGTRGRTAVHELLIIDDDLRRLMNEGAAPSELKRHVFQSGLRTLEADAYSKSIAGLIPPEEIVRLGFGLASTFEAQH